MVLSTSSAAATTVVSGEDQAGLVRVAAGFCMSCLVVFYAARLVIRWPWPTVFGKDDFAALIASAFAITQMVMVLAATNQGFGKIPHLLPHSSIVVVEKLVYSSDVVFVLAMFSAKIAVAMLYCRLSSTTAQIWWSNAILSACGIFCAISLVIVAVQPRPLTPWTYSPATAGGRMARWIAVEIFSILLETSMLIFPVWLVWGLQTKVSTKAKVIIGFWTRIPIIPITVLRLLSLSYSLRSNAFTYAYAKTEIFTQVEMTYALIAATIPCLRLFLQAMNTGFVGRSMIEATGYGYTRDHGSSGRSGMGAKGSQATGELSSGKFDVELGSRSYGETVSNAAPATGQDKMSIASDSSERAIFVRQTVDVQYEHAEDEEAPFERRVFK